MRTSIPGRVPAAGLALALVLAIPAAGTADVAKAPLLAEQVSAADHVRLFIDFLELSAPGIDAGSAAGDRAKVIVEVNGQKVWSQLLDSTLSIFKLGPVIIPKAATVTVAVWRQRGDKPHFVAKIPIRVPRRAANRDYAQGGLAKLTIATVPVDVWVIPELTVVAPFALDDATRQRLSATLADFNRRLVDASDGHIRVAAFSVLEPPLPAGSSAGAPGAITLSDQAATQICSASAGRPRQPGAMTLSLAGNSSPADLARALLHEFGHAYLGLADEYLASTQSGCPDDDGATCFMNSPGRADDDACRAADHDADGDTEQSKLHHTDCWSRMTTLLGEDVGVKLNSPEAFAGPPPPTAAEVTFSGGVPVVDMGDSDDRLADEVLNPIIATQSAGLGSCLQAAPERVAQIKFWIRGKDGRVTRVEVNGKRSGPLSDCVRKVMMNLRFPSCRAKTTAAQFEIGS